MIDPWTELCVCGCPAGDHVEDIFGVAGIFTTGAAYPCQTCECDDYEAAVDAGTPYATDYPILLGEYNDEN